jgi:hypothetical protein
VSALGYGVLLAVFAVDCVVEVSGITLQAWRRVPSHFNRETTFDSVVSTMLAAGGGVLVVVLVVFAVKAFRGNTELPRACSWRCRRKTDKIREAIARIVCDPAPQGAGRRTPSGDPSDVTVRALSIVAGDILAEYLDRHTGNDDLVEKALSAIVSSDYRREPSFADVLARHSDPHRAINELTYDLRRRLGGNPPSREAWARAVLRISQRPGGCRDHRRGHGHARQ